MERCGQMWERDGYVLRPLRAEDAEAYFRQGFADPDPEIQRLTGSDPAAFTHEKVTAYVRACLQAGDRRDFLLLSPEGRIIGESVVNEIDWAARCGNFRIGMFRSADCGRGVGSWAVRMTRDFAFETLGLHRLELDVFSFNPRAVRAYEKAGFRREGVRRDAVWDGAAYGDDILMSILEDEWRKMKEEERKRDDLFE